MFKYKTKIFNLPACDFYLVKRLSEFTVQIFVRQIQHQLQTLQPLQHKWDIA